MEKPKSRVGIIILVTIVVLGLLIAYLVAGRAERALHIGKSFAEEKVTGHPASVLVDLEKICEIATESETRAFADLREKSTWLTERISAALTTKKGFTLFKAVGLAAPEQKWLLFKAAAHEDGVPDWECPALQRLMTPPPPTQPAPN